MKIVIVGDGKVGKTLTEQLSNEGHDVVVIDNKYDALNDSINSHDIIGIQGNGANYNVQLEAGVDKAELLIAATSADEVNLLCCMVAKKLGAKHTIARIRNPEYSEQLMFMRDELGLSMLVNPELSAANEISRILRFPSALKIDTFARGRVELVEIKINKNNPLDGQMLSSLYTNYKVKILICAVQRDEQVYIPTGDFVLKTGDKLNITASPAEISNFFKKIGIFKNRIRTLMIIGGGRVAFYLAKQLIDIGMSVKIIEKDAEKCLALCDLIPKATIINGDGTDEDLLLEEGIENTDAFVALTGIDEENIILSLYAGKKNIDKIVAKVNNLSFINLLNDDKLGSFVSPKYITANRIVQYVRAMQNSFGSSIKTLHRIVNNQVEALEFGVGENAKFTKIPLKTLKIRSNILLACIIRNGKTIIPGGNDILEINDSVVVVTTIPYLRDLNDIFII